MIVLSIQQGSTARDGLAHHHTRTLGAGFCRELIFNLYSAAHKNELVLSGCVSRVFQESCFVFLGIDDVIISLAANEWFNVAEDR